MGRVEYPDQMGEFRQRDSRMVHNPYLEQTIHLDRRSSLENVDIHARIEQQLPAYNRSTVDERKVGISPANQRRCAPLGFDAADRRPAVKPQA